MVFPPDVLVPSPAVEVRTRLPLPGLTIAGEDVDQEFVVDTSRIRSELGYIEPTAPADALSRTVAWERANPPRSEDPAAFDYAAEDAVLRSL